MIIIIIPRIVIVKKKKKNNNVNNNIIINIIINNHNAVAGTPRAGVATPRASCPSGRFAESGPGGAVYDNSYII